ncbi:MAG: hypothetical protein RLZZ546_1326 [Bacteroidota bacterium]|jgi:thiol-disulfide isomerase/thioredoxin
MNKNLQLIAFIFLIVHTTSAQTKYSQDFQSGFGDMILIDNDKLKPHSTIADLKDAWNLFETKGSVWAVSNSYYDPAGSADDYMITPVILDITANTVLSFRAFSFNEQFKESYEVRVSPTGGSAIADFTKLLYFKAEESAEITSRGFSLAEFAGQSIRIAFRNTSNNKLLIAIDDIKVYDAPKNDISLQTISSKRYVDKGTEVELKYSIQNLGLDPLKSFSISYSDGINQFTDSIKGINIKFFNFFRGTLKKKVVADEVGEEQIEIKLIKINGSPQDQVAENNEYRHKIHVMDRFIPSVMLAEEGTGTWCGWCPRGAVNMERMRKKYPNEFIGIAVHNGDPMTIAEYDAGLTNLPGFSGFPGVVVNRDNVIDPGDLESELSVVRNISAPMVLSMETTLENGVFSVDASVEYNSDFSDSEFKIFAVVIEDGVKGYNQANYYAGGSAGPMGGYEALPDPVPASKMVYNEVARSIPFGFLGKESGIGKNAKSREFYDFTLDVELPAGVVEENASLALVILDNVGTMVAADHTESKAVSVKDKVFENASCIVYPNVTSDVSFLSLNQFKAENVTLSLYNNIGTLVAKKSYGELSGQNILQIDLSQLADGMYYAHIGIGKEIKIQKIVKQ